MGWIQANRKSRSDNFNLNSIKAEVSYIEKVEIGENGAPDRNSSQADGRKYPFVPEHTSKEHLPFISSEEVNSKRRPGMLAGEDTADSPNRHEFWIVIDNVVYDCTDFILEHPGGEQVIMSFIGEDCSWQFWRFHSRNQMEQYGIQLRIGRTEGIQNRFKEPKRFVGLSRLGRDEW